MKSFILKTGTGFLVLTALFAGMQSCRKDKEKDPDEETDLQTLVDMSICEQVFSDLKSISDQARSGDLTSYKGGCATVTLDTMTKIIRIDFGPNNCLCKDMRLRRGAIDIRYTGNYWSPGDSAILTPDDYFVNDYGVAGQKIIVHLGNNGQGNPHWSIAVQGTVTKPNSGGQVQWTSNRTHTWLKGYGTPLNWTDDEWNIEGSAVYTQGTATWNLDIRKALHRALSCNYVDEGILDMTPVGGTVRSIDYGNGTCDDDAVFIWNGKSYPFKLR